MERMIIENGGRVIDDTNHSMFVIHEDGHNVNIWNEGDEEPAETPAGQTKPKAIHFRWVQECINVQAELSADEAMHLCPLPHKVPIKSF